MVCHAATFPAQSPWISEVGWKKSEILLKPNPKDQELVIHPCENLHQEMLLLSCARPSEVCFLHIQLVGTNVCLEKYTEVHHMLILSLQDLMQSLNLETNPVCNAGRCFAHDNIGGNHS